MEAKLQPNQTQSLSFELKISGWMVGVIVLFSMAFMLRFILLGSIPITTPEISRAIAAHHGISTSVEQGNVPDSPILFWLQSFGLLIFNDHEIGLRIFIALAGILLCLAPLLFSPILGQPRAFVLCGLLTFSPVMIISSRLGAATIISVWIVVLMLWSVMRYWRSGSMGGGMLLIVSVGALVALSEPGGIMLLIIIIVSAVLTVFLESWIAPLENDYSDDEYLTHMFHLLRNLKPLSALPITLLMIMAVSTAFLMMPAGMSMVGEIFNHFLTGFTQRTPDTPYAFALIVSLFYEFWFWILATIAILVMVIKREFNPLTRFFMIWLGISLLVAGFYPGTEAAYAIWITIPLVGLASGLITDAFVHEDHPILWTGTFLGDAALQATNLRVGKWVVATCMFFLSMLVAVHFQILSRGFNNVPRGLFFEFFDRLMEPGFNHVLQSSVWFVLGLLIMAIGYFLAASIWGDRITAQGGVIGFTAFVLMVGVSSGWKAAVVNADDPVEMWHVHATHPDAYLLRETVLDFSFRETGGIPLLRVAVVSEDDTGLLGWLLRDFQNVRFVKTVGEVQREQIVVMDSADQAPDLGSSYVGQQFAISDMMPLSDLRGFDVFAWWADRSVRDTQRLPKSVIVWVREDIFNSMPFEQDQFNVG